MPSTASLRLQAAQKYIPDYIAILEQIYGVPCRAATLAEDREQATDIVVGEQLRVAVKTRDICYADRPDIGVRSQAEGGYPSEVEKLLSRRDIDYLLQTYSQSGQIVSYKLYALEPYRQACRLGWRGCPRPYEISDPAKDIWTMILPVAGFAEDRYGRLLVAEGSYPLPDRTGEVVRLSSS